MRDGTTLATDIYRPDDGGAHPTLVQRTPYSKSSATAVGGLVFNPLDAVERGYAVVAQDVRGRYASEGEWEPMRNEMDDGYDTVEWVADQTWSDGSVGIYGPSYMGLTAWHAAVADPPHLEAAFPYQTGGNYHEGWTYTGGAFELGFNLWWCTFLLGADVASRLDPAEAADAMETLTDLTVDFEEAAEHLPLVDMPGFEAVAPYWAEWLDHPSYDEYWEAIDVTEHADGIDVPVLHVTGWYDQFLRGHLDAYEAVAADASEHAADNQYLVVGPWYHDQYTSEATTKVGEKELGFVAPSGLGFVNDLAFQWFDRWLKGEAAIDDVPRVRYFHLGEDRWEETDEWPPDHRPRRYYLHSDADANTRSGGGRLSRDAPDAEPPDSYEYDPADPVPSRGGRSLMPNLDQGGIQDRSDIEEREDVLVYTSSRLTIPRTIAGPVEVTLHAASSAPDTDFTATLVDVAPDGYCAPVAEGIVRARYRDSRREPDFLTPGEVYEFTIDLAATAYTFLPRHRIRLEISSSNFPRFDRSPNAAVPIGEATEGDWAVAVQQVFHDADRPSHVTLPVVDRDG